MLIKYEKQNPIVCYQFNAIQSDKELVNDQDLYKMERLVLATRASQKADCAKPQYAHLKSI
jgi:hypothetical protein